MPQGLVELDKIAKEACFEIDDNGMHHYQKFLMWGLEGVQDLNMDTIGNIKTTVGTTSSIATLPYPDDYVQWTKVGLKKGDRVQVMTVNDKLTSNHDLDSSGNEVNNSAYSANYASGDLYDGGYYGGYWFWNVYSDGTTSGGSIFGHGNGTQGYGEFKPDRENRRFQFSSGFVNCDILLEYVSNGLNQGGHTMVDEIARKCVKYYILHRHAERTKSFGLAEKERARHDYYNERRMVGRRTSDISTEDIIAVVRNSYMQTPKT